MDESEFELFSDQLLAALRGKASFLEDVKKESYVIERVFISNEIIKLRSLIIIILKLKAFYHADVMKILKNHMNNLENLGK